MPGFINLLRDIQGVQEEGQDQGGVQGTDSTPGGGTVVTTPEDPGPSYGDVKSPVGGAPHLRARKVTTTETLLTPKKRPKPVINRAYGQLG